ncbi:MAG: zinc ribbon domain-containing protein [SAR324 cluster bacterium]|nr:zinc ribbon domain-containing protein [SAR324 cluster bacterium]
MPLYEYTCGSCSSHFSELRRSTEMDAPLDCPKCGSAQTSRMFSTFAVGGSAAVPCATGGYTPPCASSEPAPMCANNGFT